MRGALIAHVWRYVVRPEHRADFERVYGPAGDWARLFGRAEGFAGTELLRSGDDYMTIDRWRSAANFAAFKARFGDEYRALDAACEAWTVSEQQVGEFTLLR